MDVRSMGELLLRQSSSPPQPLYVEPNPFPHIHADIGAGGLLGNHDLSPGPCRGYFLSACREVRILRTAAPSKPYDCVSAYCGFASGLIV